MSRPVPGLVKAFQLYQQHSYELLEACHALLMTFSWPGASAVRWGEAQNVPLGGPTACEALSQGRCGDEAGRARGEERQGAVRALDGTGEGDFGVLNDGAAVLPSGPRVGGSPRAPGEVAAFPGYQAL